MKRMLFAAALAIGIAQAAFAQGDYPNDHLIVTADELGSLIGAEFATGTPAMSEPVLIDVRTAEDFEAGHIPGAINMPFTSLTDPDGPIEGMLKPQAELGAMLGRAGIGAGAPVILYDDRGGFRAASLFWLLETYGHRHVAILDGGIDAWRRAGGELTKDRRAGPRQPAEFVIAFTPRRDASADWILERRDDPETVVVDVRPATLFAEGHIPWAQNLPWSANLDEDGTMLDPAQLAARFADAGVGPEDNVVIHCQTGEAAAHSYFALRLLGYSRIRVYHRSWAEWGSADDLPMAAGL